MSNQAAYLDVKGQEFRIGSAAIPKPDPTEVIVKNHAVAVNPIDWKIQHYGFHITSWPMVVGCDVSGEVIEVGSDVKHLQKGDRVIAHCISLATQDNRHGGYQLYSATPAATTAKIPESISYSEASVLPLALDTAGSALFSPCEQGFMGLEMPSLAPTQGDKTVVIYGASSSVGAIAVQLAVASGAYVIAVASTHNHALLRSLGASEVFHYASPHAVDEISNAVASSKARDFVGVLDTIANADSYKVSVPVVEKCGGGNLAITQPGLDSVPESVKVGNVYGISVVTHPLWKDYVPLALQQGKLKCVPPPLIIGKGLENVQAGCNKNKEGVSARKVVIEL
jgi:NADPH:quinone reductase-like Zn-dependent oxidoreductase